MKGETEDSARWYAIRCRRDFEAAETLRDQCPEVFFPTEVHRGPDGHERRRAIIPRVLFVRAEKDQILELERKSREGRSRVPSFWIYRNERAGEVRAIPTREIELMKMLTAQGDEHCELYRRTDFENGQKVRVTAGPYAGLEGYVHRVRKNRHVVVKIEGICAVLLPFIHPGLLQAIEKN